MANYLLKSAGLPPSLFLASTDFVIFTVIMIDTWQWTPFVALIVLGGLQSLPARVYEAAAIDGAVGWRRFVYITLPLLGPTIVTAAVLRSVDLLRFFDVIYITTQGGPGYASSTLNIYAYRKGFEFFDIGYASALMITLSTIVLRRRAGVRAAAAQGGLVTMHAYARFGRLGRFAMGVQIAILMVVLFAPIAWMVLSSFKSRGRSHRATRRNCSSRRRWRTTASCSCAPTSSTTR